MKIEEFRSEISGEWDDYLVSLPHSLLYSSSRYRRFLTELLDCNDVSICAMEGSSVVGVLPLLSESGKIGVVYNSLPFFGSNGGVEASSPEIQAELIRGYNELSRERDTLSSTVVEHPYAKQESSGLRYNYLDHRIGQFTNIAFRHDHRDEILSRIDPSARRNVNKALREGISVEIDNTQFDRLRQLHQDNMRAIGGTPKADAFFHLVPRCFRGGVDYDIYVAKQEGMVIAALLLFYFNRTVEYFTPAIDREFRPAQPLSLILIQAMSDASQRGFAWWNWGGTWKTQSGVYRFKAKWSAQESEYRLFTQLNDEAVLDMGANEILSAYPNFFVVPFSALHGEDPVE